MAATLPTDHGIGVGPWAAPTYRVGSGACYAALPAPT
jgi:hypothetical protein